MENRELVSISTRITKEEKDEFYAKCAQDNLKIAQAMQILIRAYTDGRLEKAIEPTEKDLPGIFKRPED